MLLDDKRWTMPAVVPHEGNTIEALKFALARIHVMGWSADNREPGPCGPIPCAQQAIVRFWPSHEDFLLGRCDAALDHFRRAVGLRRRASIIEWNEEPGRTTEDVLAGLYRALAMARLTP